MFNKEKFEQISVHERNVLVLSEGIILSDDEMATLRLHTKFSLVEDLREEEFEYEMEQAYSKIRMEIQNEEETTKKEEKKISQFAPFLEKIPPIEKSGEEKKKWIVWKV